MNDQNSSLYLRPLSLSSSEPRSFLMASLVSSRFFSWAISARPLPLTL